MICSGKVSNPYWKGAGDCAALTLLLVITGKIEPRKMITSKIKMDNLVDDGFMPLIHNKDKHVKILVEVTPDSP